MRTQKPHTPFGKRRKTASAVVVIDHDPASDAANPSDKQMRRAGQQPRSYREAVSREFFTSRGEKTNTDAVKRRTTDFRPRFATPMLSAALVLALAITIPTTIIAITESGDRKAIDGVNTAAIAPDGGIEPANPFSTQDMSFTQMMRGDEAVVTVHGEIQNHANTAQLPGEIIVQLLDRDGMLLQSWHHRTTMKGIEPGKRMRFITSAIDVTGKAHSAVAIVRSAPQSSAIRQSR